jgi:pimeloyl-ACP methyl ester carboxylesterase
MEIETSDGRRFPARTAGPSDGRPVLLLHGFPQTSRCWADQLDALGAAGFRAVAFDQRGYAPGARPDDVAAYKPAQLVDDVLAVADALALPRFDLVAHDFGGMVAWMVAGHHPDRLETLTVASTPHPAAFRRTYQASAAADEAGGASTDAPPASDSQNERSGYMRRFREAERGAMEATLLADDAAGLRSMYVGLDEGAIDEYVSVLSQPGALVAAFDWYRSMSGAASAATPASAVPTLYVWSDQDPTLGRDAADATAAMVTGPYRFEVLTGVGHWIPELGADRFTPLLLEHLRAHPARSPTA